MLYGWLNGMHGIGSTKWNLLINETYSETAARQHGWHGDTVSISDKNAIEKYHKVRVFIMMGLVGFKWTYQTPYSGRASFGNTITITAARQGCHCTTLSCGALHVVPGDSATHVAASGI